MTADEPRARLRLHRFQMYGVGEGKSGTQTLAAMLGHYRAAHERERLRARDLAADVFSGRVDLNSRRVEVELRRRQWRHHLEADVAGNMSIFVEPLARTQRRAQFVLLVRDCFSWLNSRVEHTLRHPDDDPSRYHATRFAPYADRHAPEEAALENAGVLPISSYLRAWAQTNASVLAAAPADRLLVIRTEDLSCSADRLAAFLDIEPVTISVEHRNPARDPTGLLADVPPAFVVDQAERFCADTMRRFWGDGWPALAATRLPR
jgi:hypothetical protein